MSHSALAERWIACGSGGVEEDYGLRTIASSEGSTGEEMSDESLLRRITSDPAIFGGKPIVRGMRISVELILSLLKQGETWESILDDYPDLETEDIRACLEYARALVVHDHVERI